MQKGAGESVSLSRTTCSSTTATPSPLKNLDWWDWEETKKQIQSKAANKTQQQASGGRTSSRRAQQARAHQPVALDGVRSEASYSSPLPVIFQRIPSDDVHPNKCFESTSVPMTRSRPTIAASNKQNGMMSLRKLLSFSSKLTVTTPSVSTAQSAPGIPSVHRLTWEDEDETPLSVGRKWNLATLPRSTTPTPVSTRRSSNDTSNSKKWNKARLPTSTLSSTESEDIDDGQLSGSSSSKSKAQLRRNGMRRNPSSRPSVKDRWFVRPEIVMESKLEEEAAKKVAKDAARDAAKEAKRKNKGNSLMHVFSGSKNDSELPTTAAGGK